MTEWIVTLAVGLVGIAAGLAGQALYWGRFEGKVMTRLTNIEGDVTKLETSRSNIWDKLNEHGERLAKVEATCNVNHQHHSNGRTHV